MSDENNIVKYIDLGWENGWTKTPEIVKRCQHLGHTPVRENHDPTWHGLDNYVRCDICKYFYHYDSSG